MTLRELLKKKSPINRNAQAITSHEVSESSPSKTTTSSVLDSKRSNQPEVPEFTFIRTTTATEEAISIPSYPGDDDHLSDNVAARNDHKFSKGSPQKRSLFRKKSDDGQHTTSTDISPNEKSLSSTDDPDEIVQLPIRPKGTRRFSNRLRAISTGNKSSRESITSPTLPLDLGDAPESVSTPVEEKQIDGDHAVVAKDLQQSREAQWEKRATKLALDGHLPISAVSHPTTPTGPPSPSTSPFKPGSLLDEKRSAPSSPVKEKPNPLHSTPSSVDEDLQRAIALHEQGDFETSTTLFAALSDESGPNIPLAQVLYGLSLRHGWGCTVDLPKGLYYLSLAAQTSASIKSNALSAGLKQGGAAKGELVIAIFELANCFRHGWGIKADPVAARTYYETAANLGDLDAMEELAACLVNGVGGPKDKFKAAQYLRLAESKGRTGVGNSWIWKEKYNPT